jgi:transketolase
MRNAYIAAVYDLAGRDSRILALVADNGAIVYDRYRRDFPERFINFGIAEANMISVAAGLAACGKIPFAYTIAGFLTMRAYEQIRNDVCLQRMNVKLVGIGAGFAYSDLGPTHHTVEDFALMRILPGMTIFAPCDPQEARRVTFAAAEIDGPVYIRLATGGSPKVYDTDVPFTIGKAVSLHEGNDLTIVTTGHIVPEVFSAVRELDADGIQIRLLHYPTVKPFDEAALLDAADQTGLILTVEEHSVYGGLGGIVSEVLAEHGTGAICKRLGLRDRFPAGYGSYAWMKEHNGLSTRQIVLSVRSLMECRNGSPS